MNRIKAIVADVEGTTSSVDFVHRVLFPYAGKKLGTFLRAHGSEPNVSPLLDDARQEANEPEADIERLVQVLLQWIAEDRKATSLKALQGLIWEHGYRNGDFKGHVYADTAPTMRRWAERGVAIYIYSSGSVKAQQLLFEHSEAGDLRPLIAGYFDTHVGRKRDPASYRAIIEHIGIRADSILFLSDTAEELDAAAEAGMATIQIARDEPVESGRHAVARDFDQVVI